MHPSSSQDELPAPEFSHKVALAELGKREVSVSLEANPQERTRLAKRLRLVAIDHLSGKFTLAREAGGVVRAEGHLKARCTQTCVVSLEPLACVLDKPLLVRFFPRVNPTEKKAKQQQGVVLIEDPFAQDEEDALFYDAQGPDLGEALVQEFALSLDPYPRGANATLAQTTWGSEVGSEVGNEAGSETGSETKGD